MFVLRDYQQKDIDAMPIWSRMYGFQQDAVMANIAAMKKTTASLLTQAPTSSGKSLMIVSITQWFVAMTGRNVLVISPNADITRQNYNEFIEWGSPASIFSAKLGIKSTRHPVIFGEPVTVNNSIDRFATANIGLVIIDEAISTTPTIKKIITALKEVNDKLRLIGFEAQPLKLGQGWIYKLDQHGHPVESAKNPFWDRLIYKIPMRTIVEGGYVCPPMFFDSEQKIQYSDFWQTMTYDDAPTYHVEQLQRISKNSVNFTPESIRAVYEGDDKLTDKIVSHVVKVTEFIRPHYTVLMFAGSLSHARYIASLLPTDKTLVIDGDTDDSTRRTVKSRIERGDLWYLINYGVYTRGFSEWRIFAAAFLRETQSANLFEQMAGRPIRHARHSDGSIIKNEDGSLFKRFGMILDYAKNLSTHWPTEPYEPAAPMVAGDGVKNPIDVTCPVCHHINMFSEKPNKEQIPIDAHGYFMDAFGHQLLDATGHPIAAHFGQRCQHISLTPTGTSQCDHRWNYRDCPECGGENSLSARECVHCGAELVDPNDKLILKEAVETIKKARKEELTHGKVTKVEAMQTKQGSIMLIYTLEDKKRVSDFINTQSDKQPIAGITKAILSEMHLPGVTSHSAIINAINGGQARVPVGIAWRKREGKDFVEIKSRVYA